MEKFIPIVEQISHLHGVESLNEIIDFVMRLKLFIKIPHYGKPVIKNYNNPDIYNSSMTQAID